MRYRQSLRHRITLSFLLFGALLSIVIAAGVYFAVEDIEEQLLEDGLRAELEHFLSQPQLPDQAISQLSSDVTRYYVTEAQRHLVPSQIRDLPLGSHNLDQDNKLFHVLIANHADGTVYLIKDASSFEQREIALHYALATSVIVAILIALWLGSWLSTRVISPVSELAQQVAERKVFSSSPRIAGHYANDEVGQLAATFDTYLQQMEQLIEREQAFTADASHELRTPLTIISGAAELLQENPELSERALKQVQRISRASERMSQMLEILLMLARETSSTQAQSDEQCQVHEVAREVVEQHRFLLQNSDVQLCVEVIEDFELSASRTVLSIIISNLLRNAISHTEQGRISVTISQRRIEIIDSGCGIAPEALNHLFDRHYRGANSSGSGIGLSIVKRICDRMGWQIEIESELGRGTRVSIDF